MKIAFIVGQFPLVSETFILNQITGLIDRGHVVDVFAKSKKEQTVFHDEIERYNLNSSVYYDLPLSQHYVVRQLQKLRVLLACIRTDSKATLNLLKMSEDSKQAISLRNLYAAAPLILHKKSNYDIIQCHFGLNGLKGLMLRQLNVLQGKLVITFHGADVSKQLQTYGDNIYDPLWSNGDLFLPISEYWKNKIIALGCDKNKILVHHMGIDCDRFSFEPRSLQSDQTIRLISVCRLVEKKGMQYSIRAIAKLVETYKFIEYNIVGDGFQYEYLKNLIYELNAEKYINLVGWKKQDEVVKILRSSDIFIAPSITTSDGDQEGIPVAIMEAMAMGMPIVSTLHSGIPELVQDEISGFLVPEKDVEILCTKLAFLVENSDLWTELGRAGRHYIEKNYNINILNDNLENIFKELMDKT